MDRLPLPGQWRAAGNENPVGKNALKARLRRMNSGQIAIDALYYFKSTLGKAEYREFSGVFDIAVQAIEKQLRQEEACEYCGHYAEGRRHLIGYGDGSYREIEVHYCPHCGRRLEEKLKEVI